MVDTSGTSSWKSSLLERAYSVGSSFPILSQDQITMSQTLDVFASGASDWRSLTSMTLGGFAYQVGKMAMLGKMPVCLAKGLSLGLEVAAFRSSDALLRNQTWTEIFEVKGFLSNTLDFALLKGAGQVLKRQNFILTHTLQSGAMVLGKSLAASFNWIEAEEGSLVHRWIMAEMKNVQMMAGAGLLHGMIPALKWMERGMEMTVELRAQSFENLRRSPESFQDKSIISMNSETFVHTKKKNTLLTIELIPEEGGCPQKCSHCPHSGIGSSHEESEGPLFSPRAIAMFESLQAYVRSGLAEFRKLSLGTGLTKKPIPLLPLDPFPAHLAFIFGSVFPPEGHISPELIVERVTSMMRIVNDSLRNGKPDPQKPPFLAFSVIPRFEEHLSIGDIDSLALLFMGLTISILNTGFPMKRLILGAEKNSVSEEEIRKLKGDIRWLIHNPSSLFVIATQISRKIEKGVGPVTQESFTSVNSVSDAVIENFVEQDYQNGFGINLYSRLVGQRMRGERETPLTDEDRALVVTALPEEVWLEHGTRYTRDRTVRMPYDEFSAIVEDCIAHQKDLKTVVYERVRRMRLRTLSVIP